MKITKTQIVIASVSAVAIGAGIFFGLTKTGKGLIKKWFGGSSAPTTSDSSKTTETTTSTKWKTSTETPDNRTPITAGRGVDAVRKGGEVVPDTAPPATAGRGGDAVRKGGEAAATAGRGADGGWY